MIKTTPSQHHSLQDNLTWTAASATATYELVEGEEVMISYLPVSHIVAQVITIILIVLPFHIIVVITICNINAHQNLSP